MSDIRVTGSANFSAVTNGLKKIGAESANMSKGAGRAGQSILALGQGLEDFSAAGMRGAMNNIPQFIQMLGVGAGIAGGATIALVAVNELTKGIGHLLDKTNEARDDRLGEGFGKKSLTQTKQELNLIDKMADKAIKSIVDLQKQFDNSETKRGFSDRHFASQSELSVAKMIFEMEQRGATEQEKKISGIQEEIRLLNIRKNTINASITDQRQVPVGIQAQIDKQQELVTKWKTMEGAINDAYKAATQKGTKAGINPMKEILDPETGITSVIAKSADEIRMERDAIIRAEIAKVNASINDSEVESARIAAGVAEKQLEILTKNLAASKEKLDLAEGEARVSTKELANKQELLRIDEKRAKLNDGSTSYLSGIPILGELANSGINKLLESINWDRDAPWMRPMNGANMLSSSGRIGASGAEFNSAVATVNYQRESLKELREIAKNTRKGSTYN